MQAIFAGTTLKKPNLTVDEQKSTKQWRIRLEQVMSITSFASLWAPLMGSKIHDGLKETKPALSVIKYLLCAPLEVIKKKVSGATTRCEM